MKQLKYIILFVLALAISGCKTHRNTIKTPASSTTQQTTTKKKKLIDKVIDAEPQFTTLQAQKARVTINYADRKVGASASINVYHDSAIMVSVRPLLEIELFRVEINKQHIVVVDKLNRRYAQLNYESIYQLLGHKLQYADIEAALTSRLFVVGKTDNEIRQLKFHVKSTQENTDMLYSENGIDYDFVIQNSSMLLQQTLFNVEQHKVKASFSYVDQQIWDEQHVFPQNIQLSLETPKMAGSATISLTQLLFDQGADVAPCNLKKYQQTALLNLIK